MWLKEIERHIGYPGIAPEDIIRMVATLRRVPTGWLEKRLNKSQSDVTAEVYGLKDISSETFDRYCNLLKISSERLRKQFRPHFAMNGDLPIRGLRRIDTILAAEKLQTPIKARAMTRLSMVPLEIRVIFNRSKTTLKRQWAKIQIKLGLR